MRQLMGLVILIFGIVLGFYVGGYLCFIKGIIQLIQGVTPVVIASQIAWGIAKIILASFVDTIAALGPIVAGAAMMSSD